MKNINKPVIILGLVSLFTDISSEMLVPLIPLFLTGVLLAPVTIVGIIEGIAESAASIMKGFSGILTDKVRHKKRLIFVGYGLSSLSKPVMAFANSWGIILGARFGDRLGKGIRTSPRDYLLSTSINEEHRGVAFGFHRMMDTVGALIGSILALSLLIILADNVDVFRIAFLLSFIPALLGILFIFPLKENYEIFDKFKSRDDKSELKLPKTYWQTMSVISLFSILQISPAFFILRLESSFKIAHPMWWPEFGLYSSVIFAVFGFLIFNTVYALFSTKFGSLSDKYGRLPILMIGLTFLIIIFFIFSIGPSLLIPELLLLAMAFFGIYIASTEGITKALVADLSSGELVNIRGKAYGYYYIISGVTILFSSILFGLLWDSYGPNTSFLLYGGIGIFPLIGFYLLKKFENKNVEQIYAGEGI